MRGNTKSKGLNSLVERLSYLTTKASFIIFRYENNHSFVFDKNLSEKITIAFTDFSKWELINDGKFRLVMHKDENKKVEVDLWLSDICTAQFGKQVSIRITAWRKDEFGSYGKFIGFKRIKFFQIAK